MNSLNSRIDINHVSSNQILTVNLPTFYKYLSVAVVAVRNILGCLRIEEAQAYLLSKTLKGLWRDIAYVYSENLLVFETSYIVFSCVERTSCFNCEKNGICG